jgi:dihydrofolate synthase/folylpolyglutamate synthase
MNYQETIGYLFARLPMYQRIGGAAYKANLNNTIHMCQILGNPERRFRSVHIAGTNGKGSTAHLLASVLQEAGLKTGLYTSPHYNDFRERIKINGTMIPENYVVDFVAKYKAELEKNDLSFFEMTVGMAFAFFADEAVDIAVIETGMGGRLDSTNVITPMVSVITNIGNDHKQLLGDTLPAIAGEKAGIIKPGVPVVIGETQPEVKNVFVQAAANNKAAISFADQKWQAVVDTENEPMMARVLKNNRPAYHFPFQLRGTYQQKNLVTAIETIHILKQLGLNISDESMYSGLFRVAGNTGLKGRWQVIGENPLIVCDSGHNPEGLAQAVENIRRMRYRQLHIVFGIVNDKQPDALLALLPQEAVFYFCKADIPRGMPAGLLHSHAAKAGLQGSSFPSVAAALEAAKSSARSEDMIFAGGSIFVVAEVLGEMQRNTPQTQ